MGRAATSHLIQVLNEHLNTVHETFQVLDQSPASSLEKVGWNQVIQMGQQVYKQATTAGMLWTGETPKVTAVEENMAAYFNVLQGFLLLSHGSKVGAGPTMSSCIHASVKQVVDCSFMLLKEAVSSYGSRSEAQKRSIPQLVGTVWDACDALKKTPTTNITAIGRAMTQVAVSMKDVLREMKELKPASSNPQEEASSGPQDEASLKAETEHHDSDDSSTGDLGNDLSPEEMKIAESATVVVSDTLVVIKELIRAITVLLKQENGVFVNSLERLLKLCQGIGAQIDEVGACLYPPQESPAMKAASDKIGSSIDEIQMEMENLIGSSEALVKACIGLRCSLKEFESGLGCSSDADIVPKMENLDVSSN